MGRKEVQPEGHGPVVGKVRVPAQVKQVLWAQFALVVAISLGLALYSRVAAYSALTGGSICLVASLYAARRAFSGTAEESAQGTVSNLYRAEAGKLIMMAALCAAVFAGWETINFGAFLAGFAAALIAGAITTPFQRTEQNILGKGGTSRNADG